MSITALPAPPSTNDPANFATKADALLAALPGFVNEVNATAAAMNLNSTTDTSASSVAIGTGAKSFTVSTGKSFQPGMYLVIADTAAPSTNSMFGQITSYDIANGALVMSIASVKGSGTKTAWSISQSSAGGAIAGPLASSGITGAAASGAITGSGLTQSTARILGRSTAGTGAVEEISVGGGLSLAGGSITSKIINVVEATPYTTYTSAASAAIFDDTIPQIGEGTALMSVSITPTSATSRLRVEFYGYFGTSSGSQIVWSAMFRDSTANAVVAGATEVAQVTDMKVMTLQFEEAAGSTSATTFSVRFGSNGFTAYVNGNSSGRKFGGVMACRMRVTEIAP